MKNILKESMYTILDELMNSRREQTPSKDFFDRIYTYIDNKSGYLGTPWNVSWQVCAECNLRCRHCFFEGKENLYDKNQDLTTEKMLSIIDELADDMSIVNLTITGGEPFLRKDIFEIIKKIKSKNIVLWIQTNATLIDDKKAKLLSQLLNLKLDGIQVSLDGACEEYNKNIRGENAFTKTINGIKNLVKYNIPVTVNCTVLSYNLSNLSEIYNLCTGLKVHKFSLTRFSPANSSQAMLVPDSEELFTELAKIIKKSKKSPLSLKMNAVKFFDLVSSKEFREITDQYIKEKNIKPPEICNNLSCHIQNILYINCDGEVNFCFVARNENSMGNVKEQTLSEIWDKRNNNIFFKPRNIKDMPCKKCKYLAYCKGGCMASAFNTYGNKDYPDGLCLLAKKILAQ